MPQRRPPTTFSSGSISRSCLGILVWLFAKKLPVWFRANAENISSAITKATAAREEAERQVREAEAKLAHLQEEIARLQAAAQRETAAEANTSTRSRKPTQKKWASRLRRKSKRQSVLRALS